MKNCEATFTEAGREGKTYTCGRPENHDEQTHRQTGGQWMTWAVGVTGAAHEDNRCSELAPAGVAHKLGQCTLAKFHNNSCDYERLTPNTTGEVNLKAAQGRKAALLRERADIDATLKMVEAQITKYEKEI